jgi:heme-degrading monooxygenase HmoA
MYARLVTGKAVTDRLDEAVKLWHESVAPSAKQQKGFRSARLLVDRRMGKVVSIGLWDSKTDFERTVEWNEGQLRGFVGLLAGPPTVEGYEVVGEVKGATAPDEG